MASGGNFVDIGLSINIYSRQEQSRKFAVRYFSGTTGKPVGQRCTVTLKKKQIEGLRQISILTALPFIMAAGPVVGYFFGHWLDGKLATGPYLMIVFIGFGFAASGREVYRLLKQASDGERNSDDDA